MQWQEFHEKNWNRAQKHLSSKGSLSSGFHQNLPRPFTPSPGPGPMLLPGSAMWDTGFPAGMKPLFQRTSRPPGKEAKGKAPSLPVKTVQRQRNPWCTHGAFIDRGSPLVLLRSHKAGGTPHPPHRVKKRRPVVGVHIAEKGAAGLLLIHYAAIVKIHRYIAPLRHMAMERQHSLKNRQLLFHGEGQKRRSGGILLSHAQGICPGEQKRIPSGHGPIPQQGQQCRVGQVPNDLGGFSKRRTASLGSPSKQRGLAPAYFKKYRRPSRSRPKHRFPESWRSNTRKTLPHRWRKERSVSSFTTQGIPSGNNVTTIKAPL